MLEKFLKKNKKLKNFFILISFLAFAIISLNSLIDLYLKRDLILKKAGVHLDHPKHIKIVNPLKLSR